MTKQIDGEKYYRLDLLHALAVIVGMVIGAFSAVIALDARYVQKEQYRIDVTASQQRDERQEQRLVEILAVVSDLRVQNAARR